MKSAALGHALRDLLAPYPGVRGGALVEAGSGLVWHRHPDRDVDGLWEAAVDHWRLHGRLAAHFDALGPLGAIVAYHRDSTLVMLPCLRDPDVLLVCAADRSGVDWFAFQRDVRAAGARIGAAVAG